MGGGGGGSKRMTAGRSEDRNGGWGGGAMAMVRCAPSAPNTKAGPAATHILCACTTMTVYNMHFLQKSKSNQYEKVIKPGDFIMPFKLSREVFNGGSEQFCFK